MTDSSTLSMHFRQGKYSEKGRKGKNVAKVTTKTLELPRPSPEFDIVYVCVFGCRFITISIPFIKRNSTQQASQQKAPGRRSN